MAATVVDSELWIGEARPTDVIALAELHHDHMAFHAQFDSGYAPLTAQAYEPIFRAFLADPVMGVLVAKIGRQVVGFVSLRLHQLLLARCAAGGAASRVAPPYYVGRGTLVDLYVDPAVRRQHIGSQLVAAAVRWFAQRSVDEILLGVVAQNDAARDFWAAQGFCDYRVLMHLYIIGNGENDY